MDTVRALLMFFFYYSNCIFFAAFQLFAIFSFHLFSFLSFPKLTPASCHATCEFYLKKSDACEIRDFSDITRLRKLRPGLFNSLRARYSGSPVRVLLFCFSLSFAFSCNTPADLSAASSANGRE